METKTWNGKQYKLVHAPKPLTCDGCVFRRKFTDGCSQVRKNVGDCTQEWQDETSWGYWIVVEVEDEFAF